MKSLCARVPCFVLRKANRIPMERGARTRKYRIPARASFVLEIGFCPPGAARRRRSKDSIRTAIQNASLGASPPPRTYTVVFLRTPHLVRTSHVRIKERSTATCTCSTVGRRHVQQSVVMYVVSSRIGDECMQPRCMYVSGVLFRFRHVCGTLGHLDLASGPALFVSFET